MQLEFKSSCLASGGHQHEIEAKCVSQFKVAAKAWNDLASREQYPQDIAKPAALKNECAFYRIVQIANETTELNNHL